MFATGKDTKRPRGRPSGTGRRTRTKKDPDAPKRPNSAYTLFVKEKHAEVRALKEKELEGMPPEEGKNKIQKEVIGELGRRWKGMSAEEKRVSK